MPFAINEGGQAHHMGEHTIHNTPLYLFVNGDLAVCIFFILSGIVLSTSFFRKGDTSVTASAIKRYFRLAIPAGTSVLIAYTLLRLGLFHNHTTALLTGSPWWEAFWQYPANLWGAIQEGFFRVLVSDQDNYNPVLWTMKVEFFGSFMVFAFLALFGKLQRRWIVYVVLTALIWKSFYFGFLLGMMISDVYNHGYFKKQLASLGWVVWVAMLFAGFILGSMPYGPLDHTVFARTQGLWGSDMLPVAHMFAALALLLAVMNLGRLQMMLSSKLSLFMGRISFSLYLTHFLVMGSYTAYLFAALRVSHSYKSSVVIAFLIGLFVSICVAYMFARLVDEPAIKFATIFYKRVFSEKRTLAGASPVADGGVLAIPSGAFTYGLTTNPD